MHVQKYNILEWHLWSLSLPIKFEYLMQLIDVIFKHIITSHSTYARINMQLRHVRSPHNIRIYFLCYSLSTYEMRRHFKISIYKIATLTTISSSNCWSPCFSKNNEDSLPYESEIEEVAMISANSRTKEINNRHCSE